MQPPPPRADRARATGLPALETFLAALAVALALWIVGTTINIARAGWVPIPIVDDWDRWIAFLANHYSLQWFFQPHYDHRMAVPRLLFVVDHWLFHARGWFLLVCEFCFQALTGVLVWRLAGAACPQCGTERWMQAAIVASCLFSGQQWFNFTLPFQVEFVMVYCGAAAALFALWRSVETHWSPAWILASMALATLATYSMANGVLVWPVLIFAAAWFHMPRRWIGALTAGAVAIGGAYFYHWHMTPAPVRLHKAERLWRMALFSLTHLGAPLAPLATPYVTLRGHAAMMGAVLVVALAIGLVMVWRRDPGYNSARSILLFYGVFIAGSSLSIAYGRSAGTPLTEAFEWRYLTPSYILWAVLVLAGWPWLRRASRAALYGALCAAILAGIALTQAGALRTVTWWSGTIRLGAIGVADNVTDPDPWRHLYYDDNPTRMMSVLSVADYMRSHDLALFDEEWTHWPGTLLSGRFAIDSTPGACGGKFENVTPVASPLRPGWRATGWAWDNKAGSPPHYVVLADDGGLVAGMALAGFPPSPADAALAPRYATSTWNGYIKGQPRRITAYALEADGRSLCAIGAQSF